MTHLSSKRKSINRTSYNTSNIVDPAIQFTVEDNKEDRAIPFLDTLLNQRLMGNCLPQCTGNLSTLTSTFSGTVTIFSQQSCVIHTLCHGAQTVCSNPELLHKEKTHLRNALTQCSYPKWALDKVERRCNKPSSEASDEASNQVTTGAKPVTKEVKTKGHIVTPYTQGLFESIKKICVRFVIQTYFKGSNTIRNLLVSPKDKDLWSTKVEPFIGSNVVTSHAMMNT